MQKYQQYVEWSHRIKLVSAQKAEYLSLTDFVHELTEIDTLHHAQPMQSEEWNLIKRAKTAFGESSTYQSLRNELTSQGIKISSPFAQGFWLRRDMADSIGDQIFYLDAVIELKDFYFWFAFEGLVIH
jgi:hypothetical protein